MSYMSSFAASLIKLHFSLLLPKYSATCDQGGTHTSTSSDNSDSPPPPNMRSSCGPRPWRCAPLQTEGALW